jgi:nucleoside-diphosphate-sugar epimerase
MNKIILVGGAGYIGTVLIKHLLKKNYKVICLDNLIYNQDECLKQFIENPNFEFINADIRNKNLVEKYFSEQDSVVLLAGLVGDPITKKYSEMNDEINIKSILNVVEICKEKNIQRLIFTSTCSNYGITDKNVIAKEDNELKPLSLYASAKVYIENSLMSLKKILH